MRPGFKFKYDTVLKHRKIIEDKEAKKFAEKLKEYNAEREKLESLKEQYKKTQSELKEKQINGIGIDEIKTYHAYMNSLKIDINTQDLRVKDVRVKKEIQRKNLVEAQKKKKVIDKLKENKLEEFKKNERKNEIKIIDDLNSTTTARKRTK